MSENHDSDETLLPDDADKKIDELLAALRESEQQMMDGTALNGAGSAAADSEPEAEPAGEMAAGEDAVEEFLSDEEGDFVDLDAEQLDNSADMLQLDESDALEEQLMEEMGQSLEAQGGPDASLDSSLDSGAGEQQELEAGELAAARTNELEEQSATVSSAALQVPAPVMRPGDTLPAWITPALAFVALLLSAAALWFSQTSVQSASIQPTASVDSAALQSLRVDFASLRERLSVVEKQAETGAEAVVLLERMQEVLVRMEQKVLSRHADPAVSVPQPAVDEAPLAVASAVKPSLSGSEKRGVQPVATQSKSDTAAKADTVMPDSRVPAARVATVADMDEVTPAGKIFVKGWAVNLRSYYYKIDAERLMQRYQRAGIAAEIREIPKGDSTWYRVRVMGFGSKQEANAFIEGLSHEQGRETAWPSRYQGFVDA